MLKKVFLSLALVSIIISLSGIEPKVGLALSGGGARGLAHIGVLKVIDEAGLQIDYISGTSIGAVVGGLYAVGYSGEEIEDLFLNHFDWDLMQLDTVARSDYYIGEKRWSNQYNFSFLLSDNFIPSLPQGFIDGNKLLGQLFDYFYPYSHIEDFNFLPIPFSCTATDLLTGETIILNSGNLLEAIRSSMSVPSIFAPFSLDNRLLIDGGIKMNLPSSILLDKGADFIIGVKVTSELRDRDRLTNPIAVLDQTINISSSEKTLEAIDECALIIEPILDNFLATDFKHAQAIIAAGEEAAKSIMNELISLSNQQEKLNDQQISILPDVIVFDNIYVEGNQFISSTKIRDYSGLLSNTPLTKNDILAGIEAVYNSNLFRYVYPVINQTEEGYTLTLRVTEKARNQLGINIRYNDRDDLILGGVIEMRNYIGKNSNLMVGVSIGGQRELLFDYVKNFGREWGVYFRIFPYLNEHTLYFYNENQEKIYSSNSLEYGSVIGIGAYAFNRFIIESYLFHFNKKLYRDISEYEIDDDFVSSGVGIKFYHETLDDLVFPMTGHQALIKYSYADENVLSDFSYNKFYGRFQIILPLNQNYSLRLQFEYGSYFDEDTINFDPFYVGGFDSFLGLYPYEKSAPNIKILTVGNRYRLGKNIFADLQFNIGNTGIYDLWEIDSTTLLGGGLKIGYLSIIGPLRGGFGFNRQGGFVSYISIGYDFDIFEFSRR
ncbi:MAG: patatin-like phospholipase family protein [Candidatus Cloacimonetes bacterium]|nr:patatin-like phospholipase family protein [Candidatus Cloacimonadota bacterium]